MTITGFLARSHRTLISGGNRIQQNGILYQRENRPTSSSFQRGRKNGERRPVRDLLRTRTKLVRLRAEAYTSIRTRLLQNGFDGLSLSALKKLDAVEIREMITHPMIQADMLHELERIAFYSREIGKMERQILDTVEKEPLFTLLQTIPGVGKILALTIYYETGEIERFGSPKQFCSYARVVPGVARSSSVTRKGRGSRQGNPPLKWAFMQAAAISVRYYPNVRKFRQTHLARRRSKAKRLISMSIVAHKLAIGAYPVMKGKVPFRQELMFVRQTPSGKAAPLHVGWLSDTSATWGRFVVKYLY